MRVTRGPLGGLIGVVQGQVSGQCRVRVLMELLRRRTQVSVPSQLLEHVAQRREDGASEHRMSSD